VHLIAASRQSGNPPEFSGSNPEIEISDPHVVTVLRGKRAELAGDMGIATRRLQGLRAALRTLDGMLCLLDPAAVPATERKVSRPKADWAKRGEMTRICLDIVRRASGAVCNRRIAMRS
jgi:hypothetical protein